MDHLEKDLTGEPCSSCGDGKLYPTGVMQHSANEPIASGETGRSKREYECDKCHKKTVSMGLGLQDTAGYKESSAKRFEDER